jgi:hypothetical protein
MQILDSASLGAENRAVAAAPGIDPSAIITRLASVKDARALPCGSVVGDLQGGLTFTDAIAAALEARSLGGWQEVHTASSDTWTIIMIDR